MPNTSNKDSTLKHDRFEQFEGSKKRKRQCLWTAPRFWSAQTKLSLCGGGEQMKKQLEGVFLAIFVCGLWINCCESYSYYYRHTYHPYPTAYYGGVYYYEPYYWDWGRSVRLSPPLHLHVRLSDF